MLPSFSSVDMVTVVTVCPKAELLLIVTIILTITLTIILTVTLGNILNSYLKNDSYGYLENDSHGSCLKTITFWPEAQ